MAAVTVPPDATDEEEARIKEEAYMCHLTTEGAEADRQMNAEYDELLAAGIIDPLPPRPPQSASSRRAARIAAKRNRQDERATMEASWREEFPWAPPPAMVDLTSSDSDDDMDTGGGDDA